MKTIGERLLVLREANGLSKIEMAKKLGVNKSSITRYETNEIKPNLDTMLKISELFGVSLDWIAGNENDLCNNTRKISDYIPLITECIEYNISPEKLKKAIELLKI
jgi:transcriptional regulator with XRE-family HTH domain